MGWGLAIAAGVSAAGAAYSASGTAKNAAATKKTLKKIERSENQFAENWTGNLNSLISEKEDKLYNLGDIFERFNSTGAFGDTTTLDNLRKAQEDFSALAAGDFTGFESQLRKSMGDALVNTVGAGSPIGAYAQLAADTQLNYRLQGTQSATGLSEFFSSQANNLLGLEFGIMDQQFGVGYDIDRARLSNVNNSLMGQAATEGVGRQAWGQAIQQTGAAIGSYSSYKNSLNLQNQSMANQRKELDTAQYNAETNRARVNPVGVSSMPSYRAPRASISGSSYVPVPFNEAIYNTSPALPTDPSSASSALFDDPINPVPNYYSSGDFQSDFRNAYSSFSILGSIGQKIAGS